MRLPRFEYSRINRSAFFRPQKVSYFVSAFLAGLLFQRRTEKQGFQAARAATVARAFRIYRAHLVTLVFTFVVGSFFLANFPESRICSINISKIPEQRSWRRQPWFFNRR